MHCICSKHAESMHAKLNAEALNCRSYSKRFDVIFNCIEQRFTTVFYRMNMCDAIAREKLSPGAFQRLYRNHLSNIKGKEYKIPPFPTMIKESESSISTLLTSNYFSVYNIRPIHQKT